MLGSYSSYLSLIVFYSSDGFVICHATRPSLCKRSRIDSLIFNPDKTGRLQPHRGCLAVTCLAELGARGLMGYGHTAHRHSLTPLQLRHPVVIITTYPTYTTPSLCCMLAPGRERRNGTSCAHRVIKNGPSKMCCAQTLDVLRDR